MSTIDGLPITITQSGVYTLSADLVYSGTSGAAINIAASNVTIDLGGHTISGNGLDSTIAEAIYSGGQSNITITNGTISGFMYGVRLQDLTTTFDTTGGHQIFDLTLTNNSFRGIRVEGNNNAVTNNVIHDTGGTTVYANAFTMGVETFGANAFIANNLITEVHTSGLGESLGISISDHGAGNIVVGNQIINSQFGSFRSFGVWVGGASDVEVFDNQITNYIHALGWSSSPTGSFHNNTDYGSGDTPYFINNPNAASVIGYDNISYFTNENDDITGTRYVDYYIGQAGNDILRGFGNDDVLFGGAGDDVLDGGRDNDNLIGGEGRDTLIGGSGDDILNGGSGRDTADYSAETTTVTVDLRLASNQAVGALTGTDTLVDIENITTGSGDDTIYGDGLANSLSGGGGNDILLGGGGSDTLNGGGGTDTLDGGTGTDTVSYNQQTTSVNVDLRAGFEVATGADIGTDLLISIESVLGGAGNDVFHGSDIDNWLNGGAGNDLIFAYDGNDTLYGGTGNDLMNGMGDTDFLYGGSGNDKLWGEAAADWLYGGDGDDAVNGGLGEDRLFGDAGNDRIWGMQGDDSMQGGSGNDLMFGGIGNDYMNGNNDADLLSGESGNDILYGGQGLDTLWGGDDNDELYGGGENDSLNGQNGDDFIDGGFGDDTLWGFEGADYLFGSYGNDIMLGGDGNDTLIGSIGDDRLFGEAGTDRFLFGDNWGDDTIYDFELGAEQIDLSSVSGLSSISQLTFSTSYGYAAIEYNGNSITLVGIASGSLTQGDFIL